MFHFSRTVYDIKLSEKTEKFNAATYFSSDQFSVRVDFTKFFDINRGGNFHTLHPGKKDINALRALIDFT